MADRKYVLMKWKDGWQEVIEIEGDAVGFDKYFVIERKEFLGRLVYNRPEGEYPGLIVTDRAPMEMDQMVMMGDGDEKSLKQLSTYAEGDRVEYNYELGQGDGSLVEDVNRKVKEALSSRGISAKEVVSKPEAERFKEFEAIAKEARIVGGKSQEDVAGFIQMILEKI